MFLLVRVNFFYFLHFTVSLCVCCDMVVLACSLEHKILSLQTAGLWYSTWCLTAPHTVSAFDDSAFVPAAGFWHFTMHTDCDCLPLSNPPSPPNPPKKENCQMCSLYSETCKPSYNTQILYILVVALYMFGGVFILSTPTVPPGLTLQF